MREMTQKLFDLHRKRLAAGLPGFGDDVWSDKEEDDDYDEENPSGSDDGQQQHLLEENSSDNGEVYENDNFADSSDGLY